MTQTQFQSIGQTLRKAAHDFIDIAGDLLQYLMRLPLPSLLLACLVCAIFLTVLPLTLTLFFVFLVYKLIVFLVESPPKNASLYAPDEVQEASPSGHID